IGRLVNAPTSNLAGLPRPLGGCRTPPQPWPRPKETLGRGIMRGKNFPVTPCWLSGKFRFLVLLRPVAGMGAGSGMAASRCFASAPSRVDSTVSVRQLQVSSKAKDNFERGLERLFKQDPAGSIKHFAAAIAAAPDYFEAYYHQGVAEAQLGRNEEAMRSFQ